MIRLARLAAVLSLVYAAPAAAQSVRGVVLDQTGLPLPGATVQVARGEKIVASLVTGADGTFALPPDAQGEILIVSLEGFETARVARGDASRIVLDIARTAETTTVVAPSAAPAAPTESLLGTTLTATTVARLPSSHMKARESLPLLPSVMRGPDGLMQLGGARAHDTPLVLDGFNVTDPATGISSINLPYEAVRGVDVLRDPMAITYGGLLAGVVKMDSSAGGDRRRMGVQGVIPRPRFSTPGFGRLEGIFPRFYVAGSSGPKLRYLAAIEYDYERIPVPEVTQGRGPDLIEESASIFSRIDADLSDRHRVTLEGLVFPTRTRDYGLSPRRDETAAATLSARDLFAGFTDRFVLNATSVFTIQLGALAHDTTLAPKGDGVSLLTPDGWRGNWFAAASRTAMRYTAVATWERLTTIHGKAHDFTLSAELAARRLRGHITEGPIAVQNSASTTVRTVQFGPRADLATHDRPVALAFRDAWTVNDRTQVDAGARVDHSRHGGGRPSGRVGVRYALDAANTTVIKAGYGSFVGSLPLAIPAFGAYPTRTDRRFDPVNGDLLSETVMQPSVGRLRLPHAMAATIGLERQLAERLDAQVVVTDRRSHRLATLHVPGESGLLEVASNGAGRYRELQLAVRRTWPNDQQLFVSYVRSSAHGELNDFAALFHVLDAPLLQPGGMSRLPSDARHRVIAWGTFNLPRRVVVSPVMEWRSGFLFSPVDDRYLYAGTPNSCAFPTFLATDMVAYKTFTVRGRSADIGMQLFNLTNHRNPREVHSVVGPRFGQFANSVGPIVRGYMLVKW